MVTVTDNDDKRRGRPRKWKGGNSFEVMDYLEGPADDLELQDRPLVYSRRQQENITLAFRARDRIAHAAEHEPEDSDRGRVAYYWGGEGTEVVPRTVLTELGRIEDDEVFWQAMFWYTEQGCTLLAHDAARNIRRMRTGKTEEGSPRKLARELGKAVDEYRKRHPAITHAEVDEALQMVRRALTKSTWPRPP